jgi:hypothetical protein
MERATRRIAAVITLCAFGGLVLSPRLALADGRAPLQLAQAQLPDPDAVPPPPPPPYPPAYPQQPYPAPPPAYPQQPPPAYPQQAYPAQPYPYFPPPPPVRMKTVEKPRLGLIVAGSIIFGSTWLITCATAYVSDHAPLAIPLVGPLTQWDSSYNGRIFNAGMIFVTLIQTGGLAMLIAGALSKRKVLVPDVPVTFAPTLLPGGGGLAAIGTF